MDGRCKTEVVSIFKLSSTMTQTIEVASSETVHSPLRQPQIKTVGGSPSKAGISSDCIVDDGTFPLEVKDEDENNEESNCYSGKDPNGSQIVVLRDVGAVCVFFGVVEIGVGSYLFSEFSDAQAGAWWSVLLILIAGIWFTITPVA